MKPIISPAVVVVLALCCLRSPAAAPCLQHGDHVAVIGDSITEQRLYSLYIEDYLLMCQPAADLRATQFGWSGETAPGFAARMANDALRFHPIVATTCFGMNDGGYSPMDPAKARRYRNGQNSIVKQLKGAGVRCIVLGSAGCVDADTFGGHSPERAAMYNKTLAELRDIARDVAREQGVVFADVYDTMTAAMTKAKVKYGHNYHLAGGDGVHPDRNGHLVMAYAFLKALGCDGNIGTITVDLQSDKAEASEGHKILGCEKGQIEVESSKYPFCFYGDPAQTSSTRGVLEFIPFNEDLNRLTLVVHGAKGGKLRVTWGGTAKEFSAEQLEKGINLAAEFLDNPFTGPFQKAEQKIARQQEMEVNLVKNLLHNLPQYVYAAPGEREALERVADGLVKKDKAARDASAAAVTPVKHVIKIEAI
jgi:lysophospholipase L1-like esterase